MLNTFKKASYDDPEYHYFSPEDLAAMRHAYYTASVQRPKAVQTQAQRLTLAKAIVVVFDSTLAETSIVAAAWLLLSETHARAF
jgi:hypothetical protein